MLCQLKNFRENWLEMREKGNVLANANYCINQHYKPSRFKSFPPPFLPFP